MKFKEHRKGFTIVELLVTIVILGILTSIVYISVSSILDEGEETYYSNQENMLILAGREYFADHRGKLPKKISETASVTLKTLIEEKYIGKIKDRKDKDCNYEESTVVVQKISSNDYKYYASLKCEDYSTDKDKVKPTIEFTPNKKSSNTSITVTMKVTDNKKVDQYRYVIVKDGETYKDSNYNNYTGAVTITLEEKGTYTITGYAIDEHSNKSTKTSDIYSIYSNIDCANVKFDNGLGNNSWSNKDIKVHISLPSNTYRWQLSRKVNDGSYEEIGNYIGSTVNDITLTEEGKHQLKLVAFDKDGNSCNAISDEYYIDKTRPNLTYNQVSGSYSSKSLQICATGTDNNEVSNMRMEVYNSSGSRIYLSDKKTNSICYTLSGYNTYTVYTKVTDIASNIQSKKPENINNFYYQKYTLYNPDPDINFASSCSRVCGPNGRNCYVSGDNLGASWRFVFNGAGSGINQSTMRINYSTKYVTNYLIMYYPTTYKSGGRAEWGSNTILFGRSYARSSIVGTACTNRGKCASCTVRE